MLNLNLKGTSLRETASYEPLCVKISSVVFPVEDGKKKRKEKEREGTKSHASVIFHLWGNVGKLPVNGFLPNFAHQKICWT